MPIIHHNLFRAHVALFLVNLIYGINYVVGKEVVPMYIKPFGMIVIRAGLTACLFSLTYVWFARQKNTAQLHTKIDKKDIPRLLLCSMCGITINQMLFFKGLSLTSPINASILMISTPLLTFGVACLLGTERAGRWQISGILLGLIGATLLILTSNHKAGTTTNSSLIGDICIFINAISYGTYLVIVKPLMLKYHYLKLITYIFWIGFAMVIPFGINEFLDINWTIFTPNIWLCIAFIIFAVTYLTYLLNIYALDKVHSSIVGAYIYTQPLIAAMLAIGMGKATLGWQHFWAATCIATGVYWISKKKSPRKQPMATMP